VTIPSTTTQYTLDRWNAQSSQASKYSVQRNAGAVTPPAGFTNYFGVTSLATTAVGAGDYYDTYQGIEGFNTADLGWGTANAQPVTISFWVRSSLTGTFGASIRNGLVTRSYPFSYTVSAANTWEQKTITIAGDTTGTWATDNTAGLFLTFGFGVGSTLSGTAGSWQAGNFLSATGATSVVGTNGATFYITGVQLEAGSVATPFEQIDYGRELMMCQRYYVRGIIEPGYLFGRQNGGNAGAEATGVSDAFPVEMRVAPTITYTFTNIDVAVDSGLGTVTTRSIRFTGYSSNAVQYFSGRWTYQATAEL
jgi:hypothetical protein